MGGTLALMLALRADVRPASVLVVDMPDASRWSVARRRVGLLAGS
jgi:hypothetical protein